jgi:hypothetical protein
VPARVVRRRSIRGGSEISARATRSDLVRMQTFRDARNGVDGHVVSHTSEQLVYADGGREPTSPEVVPKRRLSLRNRHAVRLRENFPSRFLKGL